MAKAQIVIEEMRNLVSGVESGIERLTDAKRELTNALNTYEINHSLGPNVQKAIDWGDTELPGVRRRLSLAESLEGSEPSWPAGSAEIEEDNISDVSPEQAKENGEEAAAALLDSHGDIPPEVIEQIKANMNDPYFAAGLASNISPEQIASLLDTYDALGEAKAVDNFDSNREDLVVALGTVFGTATRNTGDLAMPDDYADQWANAITEGTHEQGGDAPQNQAQYLALLMQQGKYSRPFLNHVGDEIYEYEAEGENGAVWGPKGNHMDPVMDLDGRPVTDVMASFMVSLENNPLAAQDFFTDGGTETVDVEGEEMQMNSRLQYLIQERGWDHSADPSNGGNLGGALEAATTTFRNDGETGEISATIASQTFVLIGDVTGDGSGGGLFGIGADDGWQMWDGMRGSVANMMADYGSDLMRISRTGQTDSELGDPWTVAPETDLLGEGAPYGASMDPELVQQLLGTFGKSGQDEHLETVLAGVAAASQWRMSVALDRALDDGTPPPAPVAMLLGENVPGITTATNEMAATLGFVINGAYHGALDEEDLEAKQAEMMSNVFGAMTAVPVWGTAAKWSQFGFQQITGLMKEEIKKTDATASGEYGELSSDQKEQLEQMILNQMLANGYFDEKYIDEANQGGERYGAPPEDAIIPGSDPPQFDFESDAYQDWLRDKFPMDDFLNSNIYPTFNEHLEAGLGLAKK